MGTQEQVDRIFGSVQALKAGLGAEGMVQAINDSVPSTMARYLTPERITRVVSAAAAREPKLLKCTTRSITTAIINAVQLGLEPGGPLGHAYLVPFMNRKVQPNRMEATLIVGYQGYIALARRSGEIEDVFAQLIYSRDTYDIEAGDNPRIFHKPFIPDPTKPVPEKMGPHDIGRGLPVLAYTVARFKGGGGHKEWMTIPEVEHIRREHSRSKSGPWFDHWEMMVRKTVIRRARHYWPLSVEMASAFELDDQASVSLEEALGEARAAQLEAETKTEQLKRELTAKETKQAHADAGSGETAAVSKAPSEETAPEPATSGEHDFGPPPMSPEEQAEAEAVGQAKMEGAGF